MTLEPLCTSPSGTLQLGPLGLRANGAGQTPAFGECRDGAFTPLPAPGYGADGPAGSSPLDCIAW